jgi:proton-translocating NAD(P)+ transhydrogenase subunit alpha
MDLMLLMTILVLALFVGTEVIGKVPPTLHTPLMSGTNAISGIIVVGALASAKIGNSRVAALFGLAAIVLATVNVVGGYVVTHRILGMFRKRK